MVHTRQTFLTTSTVDLVLITTDDAPVAAQWFNDDEVTRYLSRGAIPMTEAFEREYFEKQYKSDTDLFLGIWHKNDAKLIGVVGLHGISQLNQTATYGVCIGERAYWSNGIGTEILSTILQYAFERRNLRSVKLSVLSSNFRGLACYEKCGFQKVGAYPKHVFKNGTWHDEILMIAENPSL